MRLKVLYSKQINFVFSGFSDTIESIKWAREEAGMLVAKRIYLCLRNENYSISLPLSLQVSEGEVELKSSLRLLATLIRHGMARSVHLSAHETILVIASGNSRIGFFWKLMPSGKLLLRDIQNMDEFKVAVASTKVIPFSKVRKGVAA
jgi:hypothetical protein